MALALHDWQGGKWLYKMAFATIRFAHGDGQIAAGGSWV